ncbi:conserved hypothetical protein [delta proteobacterium NaphS2]|nr:conserved hypothetical protein [delta proteobacterium NaphS2]
MLDMWAQKTIDTTPQGAKMIFVVAKSMTRFRSRNNQQACKRLKFVWCFFCVHTIPLAGCVRKPSGLPVSCWAGLRTACSPPFFCLVAVKADVLKNPF